MNNRDVPLTAENLPGRQTGSEEWRAQRGELGNPNNNNNNNLNQPPSASLPRGAGANLSLSARWLSGLTASPPKVFVFGAGTPSKVHQKIVEFLTHHQDTQDSDFDRFEKIFLALANKKDAKRFEPNDCDFIFRFIESFPVDKVFPFLDSLKLVTANVNSFDASQISAKLISIITNSKLDKIACINRFLSLQILCNFVVHDCKIEQLEKVFMNPVDGLVQDKRVHDAMLCLVKNVEYGGVIGSEKLAKIKSIL